jgi:NTE family protein
MWLCDIGVYESVPTFTAKQNAVDLTVAVDVSNRVVPIDSCKNILEVFNRMQHLAESELRQHSLAIADLIVRPPIDRRAWFDFASPNELISLGYQAAVKALSEITPAIQRPVNAVT